MTHADWYIFSMPLAITIVAAGATWLHLYDLRRKDSAAKQEADRPK